MTLQFDDILSAICTEVTPAHANDYQKIYALTTGMEAKLAFDVLISFGFDAKVYHTPGKPSKLYISNPQMPPDELERRLATSLAYMRTLKAIKANLHTLCADDAPMKPSGFTMAFVSAQPSGKQILIQLQAPGETAAALQAGDSESAPAPAAMAARSAQPAAVTASSPRVARKWKKKEVEESLTSGPAVGRELYPGKKTGENVPARETLRKRIMLRMFGNFATSTYATVMWLVVAGVLFSCVVFAKAFVCYDFVAKKSTKWYCQDQAAIAQAEADRKAAEAERQKRLGLAPIEPQQ